MKIKTNKFLRKPNRLTGVINFNVIIVVFSIREKEREKVYFLSYLFYYFPTILFSYINQHLYII